MEPTQKTELTWEPTEWLRIELTQVDDRTPSLVIGSMVCLSPREDLDRIIAALASARSALGNMMGDDERTEEPGEV